MDMTQIVPFAYAKTGNNRPEQFGGETGYPDSGNTLLAYQFVVLTAGALVAVASAGVLSCGLVLDDSKSSTAVDPPYAMFGDRHFPLSLVGQRFAVNITDAAGNFGEANGAPQLSEATIGTAYGIIKLADGTHCLNVDNTTNDFFVVVEKPSMWNGIAQDGDTYNGVVIVEVIPAAIQAVG
jgi:hypothetical protein